MPSSSKENRALARQLVLEAKELEGQIPGPWRGGGPVRERSPSGETAWMLRRKVLRLYGRAIRLDPKNVEAYVARGSLLYFRGKHSPSREDMRRALALNPRKPFLYLQMCMPFQNAEKREILQRGISVCRESDYERHQLQFRHDLTYWYDRDYERFVHGFAAEAGRLEGLVSSRTPSRDGKDDLAGSFHTCCAFLEQGLAALGKYHEAEQALRGSLRYVDRIRYRQDAKTDTAEAIIRVRMHADDFFGALAACAEFAEALVPDRRDVWEALLRCLIDSTAPSLELLQLVEADRYPPGGRDFALCVFYTSLGRARDARRCLNRISEANRGNPREWGVTLRWELAHARKLVDPSA
jgi:tetratricopeptide (TPR) repeat protein